LNDFLILVAISRSLFVKKQLDTPLTNAINAYLIRTKRFIYKGLQGLT